MVSFICQTGVITNFCQLLDPEGVRQELRLLKSLHVDGVVVDCWWGIVEAWTPQKYEWSGYRELFSIIREFQLKLQVIQDFDFLFLFVHYTQKHGSFHWFMGNTLFYNYSYKSSSFTLSFLSMAHIMLQDAFMVSAAIYDFPLVSLLDNLSSGFVLIIFIAFRCFLGIN